MRIIFDRENQPKAQPDPYIISDHGEYYIYATGEDGVHAYKSDKIDGEWEYIGVVLQTEGERDFWAPCVYVQDGTYYMYYSSVKNTSLSAHDEQIKVAVASNPKGPFKYVKTLLEPFSIDPHVVKSGNGLYIFYSTNDWNAERAGTYIVVQKMRTPLETEGESKAAVRPTLDEEIFMRDRFEKGKHWHTIEGAFYFREGNYHYLIYSGNCYQSKYYYLGYAVGYGAENDLMKIDFKKYPSDVVYMPLIAANEFESGTGHNSVIKVNGEYYCVYHGRDGEENTPYDNRSARACKLIVKDGVITALRKKDSL